MNFTVKVRNPGAPHAKTAGGGTPVYLDRPDLDTYEFGLDGDSSGAAITDVSLLFPKRIFDAPTVAAVAPPAGWTRTIDRGWLNLRAQSPQPFPLTFSLTGLRVGSAADPTVTTAALSVQVIDVDGDNDTLSVPLLVMRYPAGGRSLSDALKAELLAGTEQIWITPPNRKPIENAIVLTLTNTRMNDPLVTEPADGMIPTVTASFVYGDSPGALTIGDKPDGKTDPGPFSAWKIKVGPYGEAPAFEHKTYPWKVPALDSGADDRPVWKLQPDVGNDGVLGPQSGANISFQFSSIATATRPGQTQLYLQFTNFPGYDDGQAVLSLRKTEPQPGILRFNSATPIVTAGKPVTLSWSTFDLYEVQLQYTKRVRDAEGNTTTVPVTRSTASVPPIEFSADRYVVPDVPAERLPYYLVGLNDNGETVDSRQLEIDVLFERPAIASFKASPAFVDVTSAPVGVVLSWSLTSVEHLTSLYIDSDVGDVMHRTSTTVVVAAPVTYTLSASDGQNTVSARVSIWTCRKTEAPLAPEGCDGMAVAADGSQVYLSSYLTGPYTLLDGTQTPPKLLGMKAGGGRVFAIDPGGKYMASAPHTLGSHQGWQEISLASLALVDAPRTFRIATSYASMCIALDPSVTSIYLGTSHSTGETGSPGGTVWRFDTIAERTVALFATQGVPTGLAVSADGSTLVVAEGSARISVVHLSSGALESVAVNNNPKSVAVTRDGSRAYVLCVADGTADGTLCVLDLKQSPIRTVGSVKIESNATAMSATADGSRIFIGYFSGTTLGIIDIAEH